MALRAHTDFGESYAAEYDAAARRDLPYIAAIGSGLYALFAIVDAAGHLGDHTAARLITSLGPAAVLALLAYLAPARLPARLAPWAVVCGGLVAAAGPLATVVITDHAIDLTYAMLIIATTGAVVYRTVPFYAFMTTATTAYLVVAGGAPMTRDTFGDWVAAGIMAAGLGAALFTARRFSVREMADANARVAYLAGHDALTGLVNRHALETSGPHVIALARRERREVFAVFVDIDHLSLINNTHGHGAGDAAIRAVSTALVETVREADLIARWGGDELVIVGIGDGPDPARVEAAVRARAGSDAAVPGWDGQVSVGTAVRRSDTTDLEALILAADASMYERRGIRRDGVA